MEKESRGLARRLQELRKAAGKSQQELAQDAGLSISIVVQLERGKTARGAAANPRLETLLKLSKALGIGIEKLITEE